jgi:hypothetical protein
MIEQSPSAPMTTVIELSTVSVTDSPTKARAYWVSRLPATMVMSQERWRNQANRVGQAPWRV